MAAVPHKAGGVSKRSTKPSYDATISSWAAIKIKGEAWMYSLDLIKALRKPEPASLRVREYARAQNKSLCEYARA